MIKFAMIDLYRICNPPPKTLQFYQKKQTQENIGVLLALIANAD